VQLVDNRNKPETQSAQSLKVGQVFFFCNTALLGSVPMMKLWNEKVVAIAGDEAGQTWCPPFPSQHVIIVDAELHIK